MPWQFVSYRQTIQKANAHNNNNKIIIQKKAFYQQLEIYLFSPLKEPQTICDCQEVIGPVGRENWRVQKFLPRASFS